MLCWAAAVALLPASALGQDEPRYRSWAAPSAGGTQDMVEQLRALIEEAERANAADPRFLADLKALAGAFDQTAPMEILHDDFRDGDYTAGVAWTVTSGRWWVEEAVGLRSLVAAQAPAQAPAAESKQRQSGEDIAKAVIGNLIGQMAGQQQQQQQQQGGRPAAAADTVPAEIEVARVIPNAFSARLEITSREKAGELRAGVYQGSMRGGWGYAIGYTPGAATGLRLMRLSRGAPTVIASHDGGLDLEDGRLHVIEWARTLAGEITVAVDGQPLIAVTDTGLRDAFDGFALANLGGDYALRDLSIRRAR
jgi:hypothetical protein